MAWPLYRTDVWGINVSLDRRRYYGAGSSFVILENSIVEILILEMVALLCLGWSGFVIVIVAGWTTAITTFIGQDWQRKLFSYNTLERKPRIGGRLLTIAIACFPFVFSANTSRY